MLLVSPDDSVNSNGFSGRESSDPNIFIELAKRLECGSIGYRGAWRDIELFQAIIPPTVFRRLLRAAQTRLAAALSAERDKRSE